MAELCGSLPRRHRKRRSRRSRSSSSRHSSLCRSANMANDRQDLPPPADSLSKQVARLCADYDVTMTSSHPTETCAKGKNENGDQDKPVDKSCSVVLMTSSYSAELNNEDRDQNKSSSHHNTRESKKCATTASKSPDTKECENQDQVILVSDPEVSPDEGGDKGSDLVCMMTADRTEPTVAGKNGNQKHNLKTLPVTTSEALLNQCCEYKNFDGTNLTAVSCKNFKNRMPKITPEGVQIEDLENRKFSKKTVSNFGDLCKANNKTDEIAKLPENTDQTQQRFDPFKNGSVINKNEQSQVNGLSFKSILESGKGGLQSKNLEDVEKDEEKPPIMDRVYSRKNSLLTADSCFRKNSVSKIDADWRQNASKPSIRSDAGPKDRKYTQSKERYFVRRNSLPREDSSSRRNSFSRDEVFSRKNVFSKNDFVPRRNSLSKEECNGKRNSANKDESFSRRNSFSKNDPVSQKNFVSHDKFHPKGMQEPCARKNSIPDGTQFSKRNSPPSTKDVQRTVDEFTGKSRIVYSSKSNKNDFLPCVSPRKNSLSYAHQSSGKNSQSKDEFFQENGGQNDDDSFEKNSRVHIKSKGSQLNRKSCWSKDEFPPENLDEAASSSISRNEGNVSISPSGRSRNNSISLGESRKDIKTAWRQPFFKSSSVERGRGSPIIKSDASSATQKCENSQDSEKFGVKGMCAGIVDDEFSPNLAVNMVETESNLVVVDTKLTELLTEYQDDNSFHDFQSGNKVGSLSALENASSHSVNSALNIRVKSTGHSENFCLSGINPVKECSQNSTNISLSVAAQNSILENPKKIKEGASGLPININGKSHKFSDMINGVMDTPEHQKCKMGAENDPCRFEIPNTDTDLCRKHSSLCSSVSRIIPLDLNAQFSSNNIPCNESISYVEPPRINLEEGHCRSSRSVNTVVNNNFGQQQTGGAVCNPSLIEVCENICREFSSVDKSTVINDVISKCHQGALGQWSPTNPVGKKKYSKEFIYSLADLPQCNIPPNLSLSIRVFVEKAPSGGGSGGGPSMYQRSKMDDLFPFSKGNSPKTRSSHNSGFPFPVTKRSSNMKANTIHLSLSLHEDVKLKETENAWKPNKLAKNSSDKSTEERKTEELYNKVRSILNKLTPQKLDTLVSQIKELPINNPDRLAGVIDLIIRKAIDEPNFSEAYAKMCKILSNGQFVNINDKENFDKNQTDFRRVLLNSCQKQFELREKNEIEYKEKIARELKECTDPEKLKELKLMHAEEERKIRMKAAGNCRFIGELFKLDMLKTSIMHSCITYLLKRTEEEPLESLCKLLTTIGKHYESRLENRNQNLDPIMDELSKLASKNKKKKNTPQISSRIRFMIQDVLDLRANNWVPRRDDNTPKTIDQIVKDADREQLETNIALSTSNVKKLDRPRQDDRKKVGGRMDGMSLNSDDWQVPKNSFKNNFKSSNYAIDTSKFENFKLGMEQPLETLRLGMPRPNMWASGAVTNKGTQPEQQRSKFSERNQFALLDSQDSQHAFNNAASNKSSTMDRDKSRDNRNLSQDDDMLPKRGPSVGPPTREGSVMRSAPPSIQPPPPVVKQPVLDDDGMKRSVRTTLDEYIEIRDMKEIEHQLNKDFVTPACLGKFVDYFIEYFLEKRKDQDVIAPVLGKILDSKHSDFTPQLLVDRFHDFISLADDLIIDYPKLWDYMAMIMGYTLTSEHFNFDHVRQSCKSILRSDNCKKVLSLVFNVINSIKSPIWISCKWNSSNVTLNDFLADNDVDEFVKTNKLEYLSDPNAPVLKSSTPMLTFDEIKSKLLQILRDNPEDALVPVQSWVNENWGSGPYNHTLIRPLMTAICEASIIGQGEKNQFNKDALEKHFKLIRYFVDYNPNLEAHCLYAVSILMEKLQHPKGLALNFFQNLMEHIMSPEGFKRFHSGTDVDPPENSEENRIRGIVVLGTRSFWVSVHENLDNSDEEGTS